VNKNKVILIGGIPGVGKTSISGFIAKEMGIDLVMSGDYLREFIRPFSKNMNMDIMEKSVYDAWQMFGSKNEENILKGFMEQGKIMNTGTSRILKRALQNGEPIIIETLYFLPSQMDNEILKKITLFYIHISDRKVNAERLLERKQYTHFHSPGERLAEKLDEYRIMMDRSIKECNDYGIRTFDNLNYVETRNLILEYVMNQKEEV
jgi:mevalonate-3-phosphate-5-kinase